MQLCKGSNFCMAVASRHLWPNSAVANGTTYVSHVPPASKEEYKKNHIFSFVTNALSKGSCLLRSNSF